MYVDRMVFFAGCWPARAGGIRPATRSGSPGLERLSAARVADLTRPGNVLLRLAARGFGVILPAGSDPQHGTRTYQEGGP
jgi:hypothetical protein